MLSGTAMLRCLCRALEWLARRRSRILDKFPIVRFLRPFVTLALRAVQCTCMPFRALPEYLHLVCGLRYMFLVRACESVSHDCFFEPPRVQCSDTCLLEVVFICLLVPLCLFFPPVFSLVFYSSSCSSCSLLFSCLILHPPPRPEPVRRPGCAVGSGPVRCPGRAVGWCDLPPVPPLPLPPRASPVCRLCRRVPRASPVSRLSRRVERRVARPSPPSLPPRASLVSQLRRGALGPVRCTGCAAGWSLAPPPPSGLPVSRLCCGL